MSTEQTIVYIILVIVLVATPLILLWNLQQDKYKKEFKEQFRQDWKRNLHAARVTILALFGIIIILAVLALMVGIAIFAWPVFVWIACILGSLFFLWIAVRVARHAWRS